MSRASGAAGEPRILERSHDFQVEIDIGDHTMEKPQIGMVEWISG